MMKYWAMVKFFATFQLILLSALVCANTSYSSIIYGIGERKTEVDWNIAGNLAGTNPNIISELSWRGIDSHQLSLGGIWVEGDYFFQALSEYGNIHDGENQDSDYNLDNRQGEFSRSINSAGKGHLLDFDLNYGRHYFLSNNLKVSPAVGYGFHRQHLKIYDGTQIIGSADLTGLDSLYQANWHGPKVGIGLDYKINRSVISFNMDLQNIFFYGHTDWNLRTDLNHPKSMSQKGSGSGTKMSFSYERAVSDFSSISLVVSQCDYSASGDHTFHLLSGDSIQKLNEVNWEGSEIKLDYRSLF